ncbi:MAG: 50S ribosomal protein L17 [Verrucomicrobia bacterium]|nr:50S ribosomal protein L17 [Verrucomicrobiota bacterium]MBS0635931.1 50S ribosomal protein L17 [Verrucomicrobiota bacterium]
MRHANSRAKLSKTSSHRRCMFANMLKSLVDAEQIVTTVPKAKELKRFADQLITLAKKNTLASRRQAIGWLMVRYNSLTPKEARDAKNGDKSSYNNDRKVIEKLFGVLGPRFEKRAGGYTRIMRLAERRAGDNTQECIIQYLDA